MTIRLFVLILASVVLSVSAQVMLKLGVTSARGSTTTVAGELHGLLLAPLVHAGLGAYGLSALLWLFVLARAPLSLAYPFVGLGFVATMLAGIVYLGETASLARVGGTVLIAAGCVLVARSAA